MVCSRSAVVGAGAVAVAEKKMALGTSIRDSIVRFLNDNKNNPVRATVLL